LFDLICSPIRFSIKEIDLKCENKKEGEEKQGRRKEKLEGRKIKVLA